MSRQFLQAGFTLIELLVALILLSVIFLLVNSAITFGQRNWSVGEENDSDMSAIVASQSLVRRLLSESRPFKILAGENKVRLFFVGNANSLRFISQMPPHLGVGGNYQIAIYLTEPNDSDKCLEISWQLFRGVTASPADQARHEVLLGGIEEMHLEYFGSHTIAPNDQREAPKWWSNWEDTRYLPDLVRMRIKFKNDERFWPDLIIAPMVQTLDVTMDPGDGALTLD